MSLRLHVCAIFLIVACLPSAKAEPQDQGSAALMEIHKVVQTR